MLPVMLFFEKNRKKMTASRLYSLLPLPIALLSTLFLSTILQSVLASSAQAEDWFFVAESESAIKFFLDRDSIKRQGSLSAVKTFEVRHKPEEDGAMAAIVQREYSCKENKSRVKQIAVLFEDGSMRVFKESLPWEAVKAESVDALVFQKVCNSQERNFF
jgi:hypothetical protein